MRVSSQTRGIHRTPWLLYGLLLIGGGLALYLLGVLMALSRMLIPSPALAVLNQEVLWYGGVPMLLGILLVAVDLAFLMPLKRRKHGVRFDVPAITEVTAVLTAYNDEPSIGRAVDDFRAHPRVKRVIVVDNNSSDGTAEAARNHGAIVVTELAPGYGHCVYRALSAGMAYEDTELTLLCEGDLTFRAFDVDKFLAYIPHADIVNGTRIVEQLRSPRTQLTTFMYYGNFFVGKLLEAKHLGTGTFTDVGTTYKLCRNRTLQELLPRLNPAINLEFNAHFLDTALHSGVEIVECPVTFFDRVGVSKGGNVDNRRALKVGLAMIRGLLFGWPRGRSESH
ncbi:MAG TPA: glycosyltransferase family 2 protein [Thermoanaerobaculia bacterium]|nr:glycosyltransferase family 2 protein [Thermoanaerobaculia bacterium]